jgi:hypothetical protein
MAAHPILGDGVIAGVGREHGDGWGCGCPRSYRGSGQQCQAHSYAAALRGTAVLQVAVDARTRLKLFQRQRERIAVFVRVEKGQEDERSGTC